MLGTLIIIVFVVGYACIALEHNIKVDKAASALITGMLCWTIYVFSLHGNHDVGQLIEHGDSSIPFRGGLIHHLYEIASILFFLLGAMTIVELVDAHEGFSIITDRIKTNKKVTLLWILSILTFFLSAALDNLTTSIVMVSLLRKLIKDTGTRWFFAGFVVIAANSGGAWSPIGDVTTTMLWIKGQLPNVPSMIFTLLIPSLISMLVPLIACSFILKGSVERPMASHGAEHYLQPVSKRIKTLVFFAGVLGLLFVPIFKTVTHLPPFMGMMLSLGVLWAITEMLHKRSLNNTERRHLTVVSVLQKIDVASVLFFLGILMAVSALQEFGHLNRVAQTLDSQLKDIYSINILVGLLSALVDNVPLVAAAQGMYEIAPIDTIDPWSKNFVSNGPFWQFLAYCAGTGGSALIIGSAAGVAIMGLEKIDFFWYLKKISWLAILGYFSGAAAYILMF